MKLIYKKALWMVGGVLTYSLILILGAVVFVNVNVATFFWGEVFPFFILMLATISGVLMVLHGFMLKEPIPYDLNSLKHEVLNQLENDFDCKDLEALDEMLQCLLKDDRPNHEVLHAYLSDTGQQNLKDGLTHKRWED